MTNSDVKARIRAIWGFKNSLLASLAFILFGILTAVLCCTGIGSLVVPIFTMAYASMWLHFVRTSKLEFGRMIKDGFANFLKNWVLVVVQGLFIALWSLLFVIPGIVKSYAYAMAPYILLDNPEIGVMEALSQSQKMMKGYKAKLFWIDFGFALLSIIAPLTLGLLYLDIFPRRAATHAAFYEELKKQQAPAEEAQA